MDAKILVNLKRGETCAGKTLLCSGGGGVMQVIRLLPHCMMGIECKFLPVFLAKILMFLEDNFRDFGSYKFCSGYS